MRVGTADFGARGPDLVACAPSPCQRMSCGWYCVCMVWRGMGYRGAQARTRTWVRPGIAAVLAFPQRLRRRHAVDARREDGARLDGHEALMRNRGGGARKQPAADHGGSSSPSEGDHVAHRVLGPRERARHDTGSDRCRRSRSGAEAGLCLRGKGKHVVGFSPRRPLQFCAGCPVGSRSALCNEGQGDRPGGQVDKGTREVPPLNATPWREDGVCVSATMPMLDQWQRLPLSRVGRPVGAECNIRKGGQPRIEMSWCASTCGRMSRKD